jgi:hypothetical protein
MFETLLVLPTAFWVVMSLLAAGMLWSSTGQLRNGIGLPMLAVLGTTAVWYAGDALYNDYRGDYAQKFTSAVLTNAWWQVAWFLAFFLILTPVMHRMVNRRHRHQNSRILEMLKAGTVEPLFQLRLNDLFWICAVVWLALAIIASIRLGNEAPSFFLPFLGQEANPWSRGRIGGGFDALLSLAWNLQLFVAAMFGVITALARDNQVRFLALVGCLMTWPFFIFGSARNPMLAVVVPAILAWVFLRLRGGMWQKTVALVVCFLLINAWFSFVIANRSSMSITTALEERGFNLEKNGDVHHEGLNMFEELCWINLFLQDGTFNPPWGQEYLAEIANPIPRTLWPGKPLIGIDYAIARGQSFNSGQAGVGATISTGMIGQGVVNFGRVLGPAFAALLMSLWAVGLARLDLEGQKVGRIPLFALGIILTFNLGRDITLITLYTFVFGSAIVWWLEWREKSNRRASASGRHKQFASRKGRDKRRNVRPPAEPSPHVVTTAISLEPDSPPKPQI